MPDALTKAPATPAVGPDDPFYGLEEPISVETYLRIERQALEKHEYMDGHVRLLHRDLDRPDLAPGATLQHLRLASNIHTEVAVALRGTDCFVYTSDLRVWIEHEQAYTYPDVTVACEAEQMKEGETMGTLLNPTLIADVLSPSTEGYDRGAKFALYQTIPSLKTYVLAAQDRRRVEVFDRLGAPNRWELCTYGPDAEAVALPTVGAEIPMDALYARVDLGAA